MSFSQNMQYLRKLKGITQEKLADTVGVSRQSVSKWETGDAFPETEKIMQLCDIFGIPMDVLMRGDAENYVTGLSEEKGANEAKTQDGDDGPLCLTCEEAEKVKDISTLPKKTQKCVASSVADGVIFVIAITVYICLGAILGLWHPTWVIFIFALALCTLLEPIIRNKNGAAVSVMCGMRDSVILFAPAVYLLLGFLCGLWHPGWVIFIIAVALMTVFDVIKSAIKRRKKQEPRGG